MTPKEILLNAIKRCKVDYCNGSYKIVIVEADSGNKYVCIDDKVMLNMNMRGYMRLDAYDQNLLEGTNGGWDITAIYITIAGYPVGYKTSGECIWSRPKIKEITLEEIAEKFDVNVEDIRIKG